MRRPEPARRRQRAAAEPAADQPDAPVRAPARAVVRRAEPAARAEHPAADRAAPAVPAAGRPADHHGHPEADLARPDHRQAVHPEAELADLGHPEHLVHRPDRHARRGHPEASRPEVELAGLEALRPERRLAAELERADPAPEPRQAVRHAQPELSARPAGPERREASAGLVRPAASECPARRVHPDDRCAAHSDHAALVFDLERPDHPAACPALTAAHPAGGRHVPAALRSERRPEGIDVRPRQERPVHPDGRRDWPAAGLAALRAAAVPERPVARRLERAAATEQPAGELLGAAEGRARRAQAEVWPGAQAGPSAAELVVPAAVQERRSAEALAVPAAGMEQPAAAGPDERPEAGRPGAVPAADRPEAADAGPAASAWTDLRRAPAPSASARASWMVQPAIMRPE